MPYSSFKAKGIKIDYSPIRQKNQTSGRMYAVVNKRTGIRNDRKAAIPGEGEGVMVQTNDDC